MPKLFKKKAKVTAKAAPKEVKAEKVEKKVDLTQPQVAKAPKESFAERTKKTQPWE